MAGEPGPWQRKLQELCAERQMLPPIWNEFSDRRGGRTAWSSAVTVAGRTIRARYFYDGQYVENAREDAAERALAHLGYDTSSRPSDAKAQAVDNRLYGAITP